MCRVLQLSSRLPYPPDDGGRIATWNLSRCLRHNGYDIDLVCFVRKGSMVPAYDRPLAEVFASVVPIEKDVERQYPLHLGHALATGSSYFVRKFWSRRFASAVRNHLAHHTYDATLVDNAFMGVYLPVLRKHVRAAGRIILREHNVEYEILERLAQRESRRLTRSLLRREATCFRRYELGLVREADEVRTITERDADTLRAAGVERPVSVLDPFVDVDEYRRDPTLDVETHSVVSVAGMSWLPNVNGILWFHDQVWPQVVRAHPRAKFYIVGKNPPPRIRRLATENVIVTGHVADDKPFIQRAHLFIVPLFEGSGVRIKILTALAMGSPVLSTPVGAEGITWDDLLIESTPQGWVQAISKQFQTPAEPSSAAVAYMRKRYDWRRELRL